MNPYLAPLVVCECGDLQTLHRFGVGPCMRVKRGAPCECQKYREPVAGGAAGVAAPVSLVDQFTVKP